MTPEQIDDETVTPEVKQAIKKFGEAFADLVSAQCKHLGPEERNALAQHLTTGQAQLSATMMWPNFHLVVKLYDDGNFVEEWLTVQPHAPSIPRHGLN
jgi:hypothetical protein